MRTKFFLLIIVFFLPIICLAGQNPIDSLKQVVAKATVDTVKVDALNDLSAKYRNTEPDTALIYANQAKELAEKINYTRGLGYAYKAIGLVHNIKSDYLKALLAWKEALRIFEEDSIKVGVANMLSNIGVIFYNKTMEDSALGYYLRSLKVSEEIKDTFRIATALGNVGAVYSWKPGTYDKSMEYHRRALALSIIIKDTSLMGVSLANIGELFVSMYENEKALTKSKIDSSHKKNNNSLQIDTIEKKLDSALVYLKKAREFYSGSSDLPYALNNIGKAYRKKGEYKLAESYYQQALDTAKMLDSKLDMAQAYLGLAQTDTSKEAYKEAIPLYLQTEKLLKESERDSTYDMQYTYEGLSRCYAALKNYDEAFRYQTLLIDVKSKIYVFETENKLATKLFGFELNKSQADVAIQKAIVSKQKVIRNGFIGGFAVVLMFAGVFFTQRNRISKEKKRSDELLLNILPEETAEELKLTGTAQAKSFDLVSVLFTDFKNFTQASEKLTPKELVAEINFCYCEFDKIITKYGIEKIKTIGDAYMCAGGLPVPNTTHPEDIVKAGLEMVRFIERNKQERLAKGLPFFELRCGIHTGPVVAGIVGIKKFAYDIWGDTVNTASRMESSGEIGRVNVSGETYELIKNKFKCTYRGKVKAKNKGEIDMYFVEDVA